MRLTLKEAKEFLEQLPQDSVTAIQLREFIDSIENEELKEFIVWKPEHEAFLAKLEQLIRNLNLDIHPKLKPRLRFWIDFAIRRNCRCVMLPERECPCIDPLRWGCPLLRKGD